MQIVRAVLAGGGAALAGASLWMMLVVALHLRLGFLAIGIGVFVGAAVRQAARGRSEIFGVIAMFAAVFGCVLGDIAAGVLIRSDLAQVPVTLILKHAGFRYYREVFGSMITVRDVVFYCLALFASYKYAIVVE
jgi:hypothetical protein